jgi:hypothetical protein
VSKHYDRIEAEAKDGTPAWPCYLCGRDSWDVTRPYRKSKSNRPMLYPAVCNHCHIMECALHVDGAWLGIHAYSKSPASLYDFVQEHAAYLRETTP